MLGKLIPCGGGAPLPLMKETLVLGRKPECDVTIPCSSVSGRHCMLEFEDGWWWVRDLESKNGTAVNGRRCEKQRIAPKDVLTVGRQRLIVDYCPVKKPSASSPIRDADEDLAFEFLSDGEDKNLNTRVDQIPAAGQWPQSSTSPAPSPAQHQPRPAPMSDLGKLVPCGGGAPIPLRQPEVVVGRGSRMRRSIEVSVNLVSALQAEF